MEKSRTKFIRGAVPSKIEKLENGRLEVSWVAGGGSLHKDVFDSIFTAIGREPDTRKLGLQNVGLQTAPNGKIICAEMNEQTSVPNIYAIGDIVEGIQELTPVAIQSGDIT
jgi:pyruvate/2-oxoglutarate dehydrogenase complex dihydrolipoamide dehydrogenase (E3) component